MSGTPEGGRDQLPADGGRDQLPAKVERAADKGGAAGRPASRATATRRASGQQTPVIGIRELRQHASVYVDLAERGYTVDITNRGRLVAQLVPANELGSPLERLIAAGIVESAEEPGGVTDIEPYPAAGRPSATDVLRQARTAERRRNAQPGTGG